MMTEKDIKNRCSGICKAVGYNFYIPVKINKRLTRTLGRVIHICYRDTIVPQSMEISYKLLETGDEKMIDEVIKHECAHYLVAVETHKDHGHDATFKEMCARIDCTFDTPSTKVAAFKNTDYKYIVTCNFCKKIVGQYHRAGKVVKNPSLYSCKCGGSLSVTQNW